ncbi:MAG: hypothetical protein RJB38_109 [Pseudomonadota bacterium]|jgi:hypothetical protein
MASSLIRSFAKKLAVRSKAGLPTGGVLGKLISRDFYSHNPVEARAVRIIEIGARRSCDGAIHSANGHVSRVEGTSMARKEEWFG